MTEGTEDDQERVVLEKYNLGIVLSVWLTKRKF